jgi:hypothetical protein
MSDWLDRYDTDLRDELRALAERHRRETSMTGGKRLCYWTLYREQAVVARRLIGTSTPYGELNLSLVAKVMEAEADRLAKELGTSMFDLLVAVSAARKGPSASLREEAVLLVQAELRRVLRILGANSGLVHHAEAIFAVSMREAEYSMAKLYGIDVAVAGLRFEDLVDVDRILELACAGWAGGNDLVAIRDERVPSLRIIENDQGPPD